ncbi:MAG: 30S ribosomal protein S20 [Firmicutes bacterium]|nr:30S ribosomal protein S20 [Bacillota bacterium]
MPQTKSAKKALVKQEKRRERNRAIKSATRTYVRKFRRTLESGDLAAAEVSLREACRRLDKAVTKGVLHKNNAARHKSRLWAAYHKAVQSAATASSSSDASAS